MKYEYFSKVLKKKYFQIFLKSPKKRKIRVCLKNLRVCHYYDLNVFNLYSALLNAYYKYIKINKFILILYYGLFINVSCLLQCIIKL